MLAKISDAGAKANCYLSCFNDLLGLRSLNKNLNASWTNNLIQTNLANNNAKANDRAIIPVFASKVQASIIRIDLQSPDSSGKKYKPSNIRNIIFRHILKIKTFVDCFSLTLNFKSNPNATLSGKKLLAKIVNGVKQPTVFCPFERLVRAIYAKL